MITLRINALAPSLAVALLFCVDIAGAQSANGTGEDFQSESLFLSLGSPRLVDATYAVVPTGGFGYSRTLKPSLALKITADYSRNAWFSDCATIAPGERSGRRGYALGVSPTIIKFYRLGGERGAAIGLGITNDVSLYRDIVSSGWNGPSDTGLASGTLITTQSGVQMALAPGVHFDGMASKHLNIGAYVRYSAVSVSRNRTTLDSPGGTETRSGIQARLGANQLQALVYGFTFGWAW